MPDPGDHRLANLPAGYLSLLRGGAIDQAERDWNQLRADPRSLTAEAATQRVSKAVFTLNGLRHIGGEEMTLACIEYSLECYRARMLELWSANDA